ncbi:MAG: c-type cytochrome [Pseudanabaenaceae cyanobacterium]
MNKSVSPATETPRSVWASLVLLGLAIVAVLVWGLVQPHIDSYTQAVLARQGNPVRGRSIFVMNCVACHGQWADGMVGPSLKDLSSRKSDIQVIQQVVSGKTPPMPQFQPDPQDMADLLSYLKQL